ncbi:MULTISPECIES: esterase-like activity of phytase family protein [unclassified Microcoleus]|uniref:esterase-like activity of phytase family protein n=1 Tax=unclassified Microcoleus TaxID=2642155 RepID=UPI001D631AA4|nr:MULTISPECIES: esterase-like activity of phytase family protein [unclassified Microcoleus]MCC3506522.1 esterase-like activity of phytase family protein [Microcoleus sp. PH2017_19_SFW_U_A]TAE08697.1 MAG: esterase-like activity of phytase family protein [Oscillatoriales cyanobacterium]MCC3499556.1 esterase-like activity of phytase family protein [Microcoleus sp. PH2017_15_JOR_U_A]MCC3524665.1 esterase-like activity of phytase family protein [Microcoleus sp. PH2017_20_SFW_D_A]MCC3555593.1 ester
MSQRWHTSQLFNNSNKIKLTALSNYWNLQALGDPLRWRSPRRGGLRQRILRLFSLALIFLTVCTACAAPPAVARDRSFPEISLGFLGEYQLPKINFEGSPVGGLSGITYDAKGISGVTSKAYRFYALSDDKSENGEARFYSLRLDLKSSDPANISLEKVSVEGVTSLKKADGETFLWGSINPEGIALSPRNSVFVASEASPPFVGEFDLTTGKLRGNLPIPKRYIPDTNDEQQQQGVQKSLGFESLSIDPETFSPGGLDPFRLFAATAAPLIQDLDPEQASKLRLLHYIIVDKTPQLVSENLYQLDEVPMTVLNGLTELVTIGGGQFLSLERSFGISGYGAKIYQVAVGAATDTSRIESFKGQLGMVEPVRKKLLLDLNELGIPLYNLEGMTLGPRLPDGSQSVVLVSDDNFEEAQKTQFILLSLKGKI